MYVCIDSLFQQNSSRLSKLYTMSSPYFQIIRSPLPSSSTSTPQPNPTTPTVYYYTSLDIKSLYTSCDMRAATATAILHYKRDPSLLPVNLTTETIGSFINFRLDNSYFKFNSDFYAISGDCSPLAFMLVQLLYIQGVEMLIELLKYN